ncbi:type II 3-dehydroquinate dehydratase [Gammaproteobacteria bacterium]|nr:type II 3-dehydroquinate dehydratase [Gammaproteobacteria bacterium]MDB4253010.1 type II 3-dehydroquinate dehydratase [Gammaproteobacteria bacterium]MDC1190958.1 type II 3-dehydroquinate dehydratase [Gammaproteobacteria bacterium]
MKILLINGPNLNLLGKREASIYGDVTLKSLENNLLNLANQYECKLDFIQSNAEHEIIDAIHNALDLKVEVILINPAAFTHTSIAIRDALLGVNIPFYEIHISDVFAREEFRHKSFFSDIAINSFSGLGVEGYEKALLEAISKFKRS